MAEALLITRKDVVKFTALSGNVDTDKFTGWESRSELLIVNLGVTVAILF